MITKIMMIRPVAAVLLVASAVTACDASGDDGPQAGSDVVDGDVAFPVTAEYAGLSWSITGLDTEADEDGDLTLLADLQVTNHNPFGMRWPIGVLSLQTTDGVTITPEGVVGAGPRVEVGDGDTTEVTVEFAVDSEPDPGSLSLVLAEDDRIPELVPFAGGAEAEPYPVDATFTGSTTVQRRHDTGLGEEFDQLTVTGAGATVAVNALGHRAPTGGRLAVLDVQLEVTADSFTDWSTIGLNEQLSLDVDGTPRAPVRLHVVSGSDYVDRGASEDVTVVFEIPTGATELELVINTDEGTGRIPLTVDSLPPCCGE